MLIIFVQTKYHWNHVFTQDHLTLKSLHQYNNMSAILKQFQFQNLLNFSVNSHLLKVCKKIFLHIEVDRNKLLFSLFNWFLTSKIREKSCDFLNL